VISTKSPIVKDLIKIVIQAIHVSVDEPEQYEDGSK
jgi:hypothetical protein